MEKTVVALIIFFLIATLVPSGMPHPYTVPAFLWSSHQDNTTREAVNYQTLSLKDLAKSVLFEGGWSNFLCSQMESQQPMDVAVLIVGRELKSLDISRHIFGSDSIVNLLKDSFLSSNFSLAFPYVAASSEKYSIEKSLVSDITESCGSSSSPNKVLFLDSCSLEGENYEKLADSHSFNDYLDSRRAKVPYGQADLVVACEGLTNSDQDLNHPQHQGCCSAHNLDIGTLLYDGYRHSN